MLLLTAFGHVVKDVWSNIQLGMATGMLNCCKTDLHIGVHVNGTVNITSINPTKKTRAPMICDIALINIGSRSDAAIVNNL